jgi:hypothetical protein
MKGVGMENKALDNSEKVLLLGILHYAEAIFLLIVKFVPFHVKLYDLYLTEYISNRLLVDTIIMGTLLYALSLSFKNHKKSIIKQFGRLLENALEEVLFMLPVNGWG